MFTLSALVSAAPQSLFTHGVGQPELSTWIKDAWAWPESSSVGVVTAKVQLQAKSPVALEDAKRLTEEMKVLIQNLAPLGVVCESAGHLMSVDQFVAWSEANEQEGSIHCWVRLVGSKTEEGINLRTVGMAAFGKHELEVVGSTRGEDLVDIFYDVAAHVLADDVRDGDSIGYDFKSQVRIRETASMLNDGRKVFRLRL